MQSLDEIKNALLAVGVPISHYFAAKQPDRYIVWAEDGQAGAGRGDNHVTMQVLTGTIDYFTKTENDPNFGNIQQALNGIDLAWKLNSIQYEDDTNYIHYEWVWEVVFAVG